MTQASHKCLIESEGSLEPKKVFPLFWEEKNFNQTNTWPIVQSSVTLSIQALVLPTCFNQLLSHWTNKKTPLLALYHYIYYLFRVIQLKYKPCVRRHRFTCRAVCGRSHPTTRPVWIVCVAPTYFCTVVSGKMALVYFFVYHIQRFGSSESH